MIISLAHLSAQNFPGHYASCLEDGPTWFIVLTFPTLHLSILS